MKIEQMEVNAALERGRTLPFALVRSLSRVTLGPVPAEVPFDELLEARFFDGTEEIRIFHGEDGPRAARLISEPDDIHVVEARQLMNPVFGKEITICREIRFDEDGQAYFASARLSGWKGGSD